MVWVESGGGVDDGHRSVWYVAGGSLHAHAAYPFGMGSRGTATCRVLRDLGGNLLSGTIPTEMGELSSMTGVHMIQCARQCPRI